MSKRDEDKSADDWFRELRGKEGEPRKVALSEATADDHFKAIRKRGDDEDVEILTDEQMQELTDKEEDDA